MLTDFSSQRTTILSNEDGQSAIEFILTFAIALGITFIFINQVVNMSEGFLVHYANFKASRVFLVQETGSNLVESNFATAANRAKKEFERYFAKNFKGVNARFETFSSKPQGNNSALFTGTTAFFDKRLSALPFIGGKVKVNLLSESFLGKEPDRQTCLEMVCQAITGSRQSCDSNAGGLDVTLYDNGC